MKYERFVTYLREAAPLYPVQSAGSCYRADEKGEKVIGMCAVGAVSWGANKRKDEKASHEYLAKTGHSHPEIFYKEICPECGKEAMMVELIRHHLNDGHGEPVNQGSETVFATISDGKVEEKITKCWTLSEIADWMVTL